MCCLFLFTDSSSQTCLGCVRFRQRSQPHKTSAFGLCDFLTPGSQGWCHFTRGLSWGGCGGNSKLPAYQPKCWLRYLPFNWISVSLVSMGIFNIFVASGFEAFNYHIAAMQSADFARREDFPNPCFPRQTKRRRKDAKIPDIWFFFPGKSANLCCYLLSIPWLIIMFFGSVVAVLLPQCWAKHLSLALSYIKLLQGRVRVHK